MNFKNMSSAKDSGKEVVPLVRGMCYPHRNRKLTSNVSRVDNGEEEEGEGGQRS